MLGWFKSPPFIDSDLGELRRQRGKWRGSLVLEARIPLVLAGSRAAPDLEALNLARSVAAELRSWRPSIERALFDHYLPYADAVAAGDQAAPDAGLPRLEAPADVWPHTTAEFVHVAPLDGQLTVEIGYRVAWDDEHTLGARFRNGQLQELCGSVLAP